MPRALALQGKTFGKLEVLDRSHQDNGRAWMWRCRGCGRIVYVRGATLNAGRTSACASCATALGNITHGGSRTALYQRWRAMLDRCERASHRGYGSYGGRGIRVCDEWHQFDNFAQDMSAGFRSDLTLDRIDVDGNYEPSNCRWISVQDQQLNKRTNHVIVWMGRSMPVKLWSQLLGINANTIVYRLRREWSVERALTKGVDPAVLLELANDGGTR